jgi:menaquinol-cytochrome c reductase iron-sulfur subunit
MENTGPSAQRDDAGSPACCGVDRRAFCAQATALSLAAAAYAAPVVGGVVALLNPLRQKSGGGDFLQVATLDALPADGTPRKFPVIAERVDAWTKSVQPVGAVYLRRAGDKAVEALQVVCPHAGCTVEFKEVTAEQTGEKVRGFFCPCHRATFDLAGKRLQATSHSPRDLDTLAAEVRNGTEVWVQFQNFKLGTPNKAPLA